VVAAASSSSVVSAAAAAPTERPKRGNAAPHWGRAAPTAPAATATHACARRRPDRRRPSSRPSPSPSSLAEANDRHDPTAVARLVPKRKHAWVPRVERERGARVAALARALQRDRMQGGRGGSAPALRRLLAPVKGIDEHLPRLPADGQQTRVGAHGQSPDGRVDAAKRGQRRTRAALEDGHDSILPTRGDARTVAALSEAEAGVGVPSRRAQTGACG